MELLVLIAITLLKLMQLLLFPSQNCSIHTSSSYTVPSSYNCTHTCDFLHGITRFYSVSEIQIHAWFRPMATRGSQCGYKSDHT